MSTLIIYITFFVILLNLPDCPTKGQTTVIPQQKSNLRWTNVQWGSMSDGNSKRRRPPLQEHNYPDVATKTGNDVGEDDVNTSSTEKRIHDNKTNLSLNNTTVISKIVIEGKIPIKTNKDSSVRMNWLDGLAINTLDECSPDNCTTLGLPVPSCSHGKCADVNTSCYCDILCVVFGDCCSDAISTITGKSLQVMIDHLFDWKNWFRTLDDVRLISMYVHWSTCVSVPNVTQYTTIRVITKCPRHDKSSSNISLNDYGHISSCENYSHLPFVSLRKYVIVDDSKLQIVFKNKYCARCHGFTGKQTVTWRTELLHPLSGHYFPPKVTGLIRKCNNVTAYSQHQLFECRHDNNKYNLKTLCSLNIFPMNLNLSGTYMPISLVSKFNDTGAEAGCEILYFKLNQNEYLPISVKPLGPNHGVIESLFSFYNYPHVNSPAMRLTTIQPYIDLHTTEYPFVQCPVGFYKTGYKCSKEQIMQNNIFVFNITMNVKLLSGFNRSLYDLFISEIMNFTLFENRSGNGRIKNVLNVHLKSQNYILRLILTAEETFLNTETEIVLSNPTETEFSGCQENETHVMLYDIALTIINSSLFVTNNRSTYLIPFPVERFSLQTNIHKNVSNIAALKLSYCSIEPSMIENCSSVRAFPTDQYTVHNNTVRLKRLGETGQEEFSQYTITNHTLLACVKSYPVSSDFSHLQTLATYINNICMSFSILSLIILVYYHIMIPRLLNLHGKIVVCFAISLAISQVISVFNSVMIAAENYIEKFLIFKYLCQVLGRVFHYSWICTFVWSAVMSYDICRKFSVCSSLHQQMDTDQGRGRFWVYFSVATLLPLLIVLISNIVALLSEEFYLGYGESWNCQISTFEGKLYAFDIPLFTIYAFSIVCLVISLHGLEYARRKGRHLHSTRKRDKRRCMAYTRITLMIGITWSIAVVAVFTQSIWIGFLSLFVNGLQGLLMFAGLLLNTRNRKVILARFRCRTHTDRYPVYSTHYASR